MARKVDALALVKHIKGGLLGTAGCYASSGFFLIKDDVNPRMGWICLLTGGAFGAAWLFIHNVQ